MERRLTKNIVSQLDALRKTSCKLRVGDVTDDSPLTVTLGGSAVVYTDISTIATGLSIGDRVAVLVVGKDLLVLGEIV